MSDYRIPDSKDVYRTTDFKQAAFLKARRVEHTNTESNPNGQVTFIFADQERCDELVMELYSGSTTVSMPDYWAAESTLRDTIKRFMVRRQ